MTAVDEPPLRPRRTGPLGGEGSALLDAGNMLGRATKELLLVTAERLFAHRGLTAVPLRDIGQLAGQRNNGVMQYHFGDRETVIRAIFDLRSRQINSRRLELLGELEAEQRLDDPAALVRILIQPQAEGLLDPDNHYVGFLHRLYVERQTFMLAGPGVDPVDTPSAQSFVRARQHLGRCAPHLEQSVVDARSRMIFGWAIHSLAAHLSSGDRYREAVDVEAMLSELVNMLVPALVAPAATPKATSRRVAAAAAETAVPDEPAWLDAGNTVGRATKELLIVTAERLFAQRGIAAVPLRDIGQVAGQRNNAVMQYHFGDRENLVNAVYDLRGRPINRRRLELLGHLEVREQLRDPAALVRVLIQPHAESLLDPENHFVGFLHRMLAEQGTFRALPSGTASPATRSFELIYQNLLAGMGDIDPVEARGRLTTVFRWAVHTLVFRAQVGPRPTELSDVELLLDELVQLLVPALLAPA
ncbi:MAG: TetR family transcriptional regulator [Acidobacteria bacterium]|nr:TetR family transcriptional regulator [Acidobacteriota bacterium]